MTTSKVVEIIGHSVLRSTYTCHQISVHCIDLLFQLGNVVGCVLQGTVQLFVYVYIMVKECHPFLASSFLPFGDRYMYQFPQIVELMSSKYFLRLVVRELNFLQHFSVLFFKFMSKTWR